MPATDPDSQLIDQFADWVWLESGLSAHTIDAYRTDLQQYSAWLVQNNTSLGLSTRRNLLDYMAFRMEQGIHSRSVARFLSTLKRYYKFASNTNSPFAWAP